MRYARDTKSLSDIMEKELKLLDKDHIHYMIETEPTMSVSKIVNLMKTAESKKAGYEKSCSRK